MNNTPRPDGAITRVALASAILFFLASCFQPDDSLDLPIPPFEGNKYQPDCGYNLSEDQGVPVGNPCIDGETIFNKVVENRWIFEDPTEVHTLSLPASGTVCIHVKNGDEDGQRRVWWGKVLIDGERVIGRNRLSSNIHEVSEIIYLEQGDHDLSATIYGPRSAFIEIWIGLSSEEESALEKIFSSLRMLVASDLSSTPDPAYESYPVKLESHLMIRWNRILGICLNCCSSVSLRYTYQISNSDCNQIRSLQNEMQVSSQEGEFYDLNVEWDGKDSEGNIASVGQYYFRVIADLLVRKDGKVVLFDRLASRVKRLEITESHDDDGDGILSADEIFIYGTDPDLLDTDGDGIDDGAELEYWNSRGDGIEWYMDIDRYGVDTEIGVTGDGLYNLIDPDSDNDGLYDGYEIAGWEIDIASFSPVHVYSDPAYYDTDNDGLGDKSEHDGWDINVLGEERHVVSDPGSEDTDSDGIVDFIEVHHLSSDPTTNYTFGEHYSDKRRAEYHGKIGSTALDPPCPLADGAEENVYITDYKATYEINEEGETRATILSLYVPKNMAGKDFEVFIGSEDPQGEIDYLDFFALIKLTWPDGAEEDLSAGPEFGKYQSSVSVPPNVFGMYTLELFYHIDSMSTLHYYANFKDYDVNVPIGWVDAPEVVHVDAKFITDGVGSVFLRGGSYGGKLESNRSYITNIEVDGDVLYKRAFEKGDFNFPLGVCAAREHEVSFDWVHSGRNAELWTHMCQNGVEWFPVQITYLGNMHTRDYGCWKTGVAQGPAVIRRGTTFMLVVNDSDLSTGNADVSIFNKNGQVFFPMEKTEEYSSHIGRFEHWEISVPPEVPIGRYHIEVYSPGGDFIVPAVKFYVIFNPYKNVGPMFPKEELETYAYDEEEDFSGGGDDADHFRDEYSGCYTTGIPGMGMGYKLHPFRSRENQVSVLDLAIAASDGSVDEFEAMLPLFRLVNQRIDWRSGGAWRCSLGCNIDALFGCYNDESHVETDGTCQGSDILPLTVEDAEIYGLNFNDLSDAVEEPGKTKIVSGQCFDFSAALVGLARSIGIPARQVAAEKAFGWERHVWTEVFLPLSILPKQYGAMHPDGGPPADYFNWYVFDSTDNHFVGGWVHSEESIDPRVDYYASFVDNSDANGDVIVIPERGIWTSSIEWCAPPLIAERKCNAEGQAIDVFEEYSMDSINYWFFDGSISSWLACGDKDHFMLKVVGESTISLEQSGELDISMCVYNHNPPFPEKCEQPREFFNLGEGIWYIQVFSQRTDEAQEYWGNYSEFMLNIGN